MDTHVLIWLDEGSPSLGPVALATINRATAEGELAASAMSFWEIAMLLAKGRLREATPPVLFRRKLIDAGVTELPVTGPIGIAAAELDHLPGDPADRIILATALKAGATLVTADRRLLAWPGEMVRLDARQ